MGIASRRLRVFHAALAPPWGVATALCGVSSLLKYAPNLVGRRRSAGTRQSTNPARNYSATHFEVAPAALEILSSMSVPLKSLARSQTRSDVSNRSFTQDTCKFLIAPVEDTRQRGAREVLFPFAPASLHHDGRRVSHG